MSIQEDAQEIQDMTVALEAKCDAFIAAHGLRGRRVRACRAALATFHVMAEIIGDDLLDGGVTTLSGGGNKTDPEDP